MMGQETKGSKDGKGKDSYYNWKDEKARLDERPVDPGPFPGPVAAST
jgi:saccharopine dehydrogenase-like NADP-dependent oxidoreductase